MSDYDNTTPHPNPVVQAVAEALSVEMYSLDWEMPGFDHGFVRRLAEVAVAAALKDGSEGGGNG